MICLIEPQLQWLKKMVKKLKLRHIFMFFALLWLFDLFGAFTHVFELPYDGNFNYPYEGSVHDFVEAIKHKKKPELAPINTYNYTYIHSRKELCVDSDYRTLRIVFLVKSAAENFARRTAIRSTWGFKKRFFDVPTRIVFLLGTHENAAELQGKIDEEAAKFKDILQANFIDSYFNNTIKTMMGFRWAYENCKNSKFFMFVDDDIYVSVKNLLRFLRNPGYYPEYLKDPSRIKREIRGDVGGEVGVIGGDVGEIGGEMRRTVRMTAKEKIMMRRREGWKFHNKTRMIKEINVDDHNNNNNNNNDHNNNDHNNNDHNNNDHNNNVNMNDSMIYGKLKRGRRQVFDFELPNDVKLFAGYVFVSSPHRHKTSKWYVTLEEYPYHLWPPYVTAGAYVLSKVALIDMYLTSLYTKHFRFDDIFLGIVAKKAEIEPFHCDEFHFYKKDYTKFNYKYVITSHGYGDPEELVQIWNEQKSLGNA